MRVWPELVGRLAAFNVRSDAGGASKVRRSCFKRWAEVEFSSGGRNGG